MMMSLLRLWRRTRGRWRRQIDARSWAEGERSVELVERDERTLISTRRRGRVRGGREKAGLVGKTALVREKQDGWT